MYRDRIRKYWRVFFAAVIMFAFAWPADSAHASGGSISGLVRADGQPLAGIGVVVFTTKNTFVTSTLTKSDGTYVVPSLPAETYIIAFNPDEYNRTNSTHYVVEYSGGAYNATLASPVTVSDDIETTDIDADMDLAGWLSGTVSGTSGPLESVSARVYDAQTGAFSGIDVSDSQGNWNVGDLAPGTYLVEFQSGWTQEYYDDVATIEEAVPLTVSSGAGTENVDALLQFYGDISGTVMAGGVPLAGVEVQARDGSTRGILAQTLTDASGGYTFSNLAVRPYLIYFDASSYNSTHNRYYVSEYYSNAFTLNKSKGIKVFGGHTVEGVDADLEEGGILSGRVTCYGSGGCYARVLVSDRAKGEIIADTLPAVDGTYRMGPLPAGEHTVEFRPDTTINGVVGEYYNDADSAADSAGVTVIAGAVTSNIDADLVLDTLISGKILGDGKPLAGIDVYAIPAGTDDLVGWATTGSDGTYAIRYLPPGKYELFIYAEAYNINTGTEFESKFYGQSYFDNTPAELSVAVGNGSTWAIGANLSATTSCISGRVTTAAGKPLEGIDVWAWLENYLLVGWGQTDSNGYYTIPGLYAGNYVVEFDPEERNSWANEGLQGEYYDASGNPDAAKSVTVIHGETTSNINATLNGELQPVFRFYNKTNGTHFFTPSAEERDTVIEKWPNVYTYEGIAYYINPMNNTQPLYRFYNRKSGSHFYTASAGEAATILAKWPSIFSLDGQTYSVNPTPVPNSVPVFRFYNKKNGSHFYTASAEERDTVIKKWPDVYSYEGPAFWIGQ